MADLALTTSDFETEVLQSEIPVLIDFWAVWFGPCIQIAPHVEAIAAEYTGKAKVCMARLHSDPLVIFFLEMDITGVECPDDIKKLSGLDADRTSLDDLSFGVAADRAIEIGPDNSDLFFTDRLDENI